MPGRPPAPIPFSNLKRSSSSNAESRSGSLVGRRTSRTQRNDSISSNHSASSHNANTRIYSGLEIEIETSASSNRKRPSTMQRRRYVLAGCILTCMLSLVIIKSGILDATTPEDVEHKMHLPNDHVQVGTRTVSPQEHYPTQKPTHDAAVPQTQTPTAAPTKAPKSNQHPTSSNIQPTSRPTPRPKTPKAKPTPTQSIKLPAISPATSVSYSQGRINNEGFTATESSFLEQYCNFQPKTPTDKDYGWYPSSDKSAWKQRAPGVIIIGTQQSGSATLYYTLAKHPNINANATKTKNLKFYLPNKFNRYLPPLRLDADRDDMIQKRKVYLAREAMYNSGANYNRLATTLPDTHSIAMDGSANYFTASHLVPYNILCTTPWSKLVLMMRNPVDRLYAQWAYYVDNFRLEKSFEDWIAIEFDLMIRAGLIERSGTDALVPTQPDNEYAAWKSYLQLIDQDKTFQEPAIGVSLYVIPLQHWIDAYTRVGKNITQSLFVLPTEILDVDYASILDRLLPFMGLPAAHLRLHRVRYQKHSNHVMSDATRIMLERFFRTYNDRLLKVLKEHKLDSPIGHSNWKRIWK